MEPRATVIGRLAPSPTGEQHVGNARTYLAAWLSARSKQGEIVLRIEDIDAQRMKAGAIAAVCVDLRWLGFDWDGEPIKQTQRFPLYQSALETLRDLDLVYPCTCTRADIERAASAPHSEHEGPIYPGICAHRHATDIPAGPFAWRMRVGHETIAYEDGSRGPTSLNLHEIGGDFVVWRSVDAPAYQLAVVVDDAAQGVTEVIRGDDLVPSTPRQLLLYRALGLKPPSFTHVPLVVGPDGKRLAKRQKDIGLTTLRKAGVRPEKLLGLLAYSCGWLERIEPVSLADLLSRFDLRCFPRQPFVLTPEMLESIGYRG